MHLRPALECLGLLRTRINQNKETTSSPSWGTQNGVAKDADGTCAVKPSGATLGNSSLDFAFGLCFVSKGLNDLSNTFTRSS